MQVEHSFLYDFLISPRYRISRHVLFILMLAIIAFNQTYYIYIENITAVGNYIYLFGFVLFAGYITGVYFTIYVLVPHYLLKKKYTAFIMFLSLLIMIMLAIKLYIEYAAHDYLDIPHSRISYFNYVTFLDNISFFMTMLICVAGMAMTVFLKNWITEEQHVSQLEKKHIQMEVEQLKDQVNPNFLFNILNKTGVLAKSDPQKASAMILKLSQLLRYQLYDGNRTKVLLSAEIKFLNNYLALEKLYSDHFNYTIVAGSEAGRTFIPPLLLIPFVQQAVQNAAYANEQPPLIEINIQVVQNEIEFTCICNIDEETDFSRIRHRLNLLYTERYTLSYRMNYDDNGRSLISLKLTNKSNV